jgi:hypothetical protein
MLCEPIINVQSAGGDSRERFAKNPYFSMNFDFPLSAVQHGMAGCMDVRSSKH